MENQTILNVKGRKENYQTASLVSFIIAVLCDVIGFCMLYAFYHNGQRAMRLKGNMFYKGSGGYEFSILFIAIIMLCIGYFVGLYFLKNLILSRKAANSHLQINQNNIVGIANNIKFELDFADVISADIKEFSYKVLANGQPAVLDASIGMKFRFQTSKYLVIQTKDSNIYYIDTLSSMEHAKSIINTKVLSSSKA